MENFTVDDADVEEASWWNQSIHWTECLWWIACMDLLIFVIIMVAFNVHPKQWNAPPDPDCVSTIRGVC